MKIKFSPKQTTAWELIESPDIQAMCYGGAKGGGKSVFGCYWIFLKCINLIKKFKIKKRSFPIPVAFMGRKQSVDFNDTTLETWKAVIPSELYRIRESDKEIIIGEAVKIQYGGLDDSNTVKKFNSAEYCYIFGDQAEEFTRDDYALLRGTLRRKVKNKEVDYRILLTANPAQCWIKDEFIDGRFPGNVFIQALPTDNPFLAKGYIDNLKASFKHRPELIEAYVYGNWGVMADSDIVIKSGWVRSAVNRQLHSPLNKRLVTCDPARMGDDETVIYVMEGTKIIEQMIYGQKDTMATANNLAVLQKRFDAELIVIDKGTFGAAIYDRLVEMGFNAMAIDFGGSPTTEQAKGLYKNRRAQMYWEAGEMFADEVVSIPDEVDLISQLGNIKYKATEGKIQIESKEDIKRRMSGRSPDRADAYVMGLHCLQFVPEKSGDFHRLVVTPNRAGAYGWENRELNYV